MDKKQWSAPELRTLSVALDTAKESGSGVDGTSKSFITPT